MQAPDRPAGNIFDIGYRTYDGPRLGRRHAFFSLYWYTLRGAFGLGRRTSSKVIPAVIAIIAALPAAVQLGIAALLTEEVEVIRPEGYFGFVQVPVALFCAAIGPEIAGRDMRQRTLTLYFSRGLSRRDYAAAKLAAFATALALLTLVPQAVLVIGNGLASDDLAGYITGNGWDFPRTFVSGMAIAFASAALSLAVAAQTSRRAYSTVAIAAVFLVSWPVVGVLVTEVGGIGRWAALLSPFDVFFGSALWVFDVPPDPDTVHDQADLAAWAYGVALAAYAALGTLAVIRRFDRIAA